MRAVGVVVAVVWPLKAGDGSVVQGRALGILVPRCGHVQHTRHTHNTERAGARH